MACTTQRAGPANSRKTFKPAGVVCVSEAKAPLQIIMQVVALDVEGDDCKPHDHREGRPSIDATSLPKINADGGGAVTRAEVLEMLHSVVGKMLELERSRTTRSPAKQVEVRTPGVFGYIKWRYLRSAIRHFVEGTPGHLSYEDADSAMNTVSFAACPPTPAWP